MSYGFRVRITGYDEIARNLGQEYIAGDSDTLLFVAEQLRFSDDEVRQKTTRNIIVNIISED